MYYDEDAAGAGRGAHVRRKAALISGRCIMLLPRCSPVRGRIDLRVSPRNFLIALSQKLYHTPTCYLPQT